MNLCKSCGREFKSKHRHKNAQFCSYECSYAAKRKNQRACPVCGLIFFASTKRQKACSIICGQVLKRQKLIKICSTCGKTFLPRKKQNVFCGLACRKEHTRQKNKKLCLECGKAFVSRKNVYCSKKCVNASFSRKIVDQGTRCVHCGKSFSSLKFNAAFCSDACRISANRKLRHYRSRGACGEDKISIVALADRDGWGCRLCGKKIDNSLDSNDAMAATIDHIIPLTKGGEHAWSNVQLAHRSCNSSKGNSPRPAQMHLNINISFHVS